MKSKANELHAEHRYSTDRALCTLAGERLRTLLPGAQAHVDYNDIMCSATVVVGKSHEGGILIGQLMGVSKAKHKRVALVQDDKGSSLEFDSVRELVACVNQLVGNEQAIPLLSARETTSGYREVVRAGPNGIRTLSAPFQLS